MDHPPTPTAAAAAARSAAATVEGDLNMQAIVARPDQISTADAAWWALRQTLLAARSQAATREART